MNSKSHTTKLAQFRQEVYQNFNNRADTLMELMDAICNNPDADSVVEYSLTPCFRRSYSTIIKALNEMELDELAPAHLRAPYLPQPEARPFWLRAVDVTSQGRQFAHTLGDREWCINPIQSKATSRSPLGISIRRWWCCRKGRQG